METSNTAMIDDGNDLTYTVHLSVTGMMCQKSCGTWKIATLCEFGAAPFSHVFSLSHRYNNTGSTVENALKAMDGVVHAEASFEKNYATVSVRSEEWSSRAEFPRGSGGVSRMCWV